MFSLNGDIVSQYKTIRNELAKYGQGLIDKEETVILTKTDTVSSEILARARREIALFNNDILTVTVLDDDSIKEISDEIVKRLRK